MKTYKVTCYYCEEVIIEANLYGRDQILWSEKIGAEDACENCIAEANSFLLKKHGKALKASFKSLN